MIHPFARALDNAPVPFAITQGATHTLVYANRSLLRLLDGEPVAGAPIADLFLPEPAARLSTLLDRAFADGVSVDEHFLGRLEGGTGPWSCSIWPLHRSGSEPQSLMVELRLAALAERSEALQREIAESLLLNALQESDAADAAGARTDFLLEVGRRLGQSLDEAETRDTIAGLALPALGAWCIVDVIEPDGSVTRLATIHPDPEMRERVRELAKAWVPRPGDPFGAPAVMRNAQPVLTTPQDADLDEAMAALAHSPENLRLLGEMRMGPLLTVPLLNQGKLLGALTFVSGQPDRAYTPEDLELAQDLAARSAEALSSARLYGEAVLLREQADASSLSRMRFLGNISHELRSPLNAIGGYVQLMQEGIHGPVTTEQKRDLERIRLNQEHLLVLINDVLNFVRAGVSPVIEPVEVSLLESVRHALTLLQGLADQRGIRFRNEMSTSEVLADADPDRLQQILINLITNAIKFTPRLGEITIRYEVGESTVSIHVCDNGIGIEPDQLEAIFEPFVQVDPKGEVSAGVGLGLAISRDLARAMRGDLTVESRPRRGSCFTVTLPRRTR